MHKDPNMKTIKTSIELLSTTLFAIALTITVASAQEEAQPKPYHVHQR